MSYKLRWALKDAKYGYLEVSNATLHPFDLFHAFRQAANELSSHRCLKGHPGHDYRTWKWWPKHVPLSIRKQRDHIFWDSYIVSNAIEELVNYLDCIAPTGYYFGCPDGDGACFGWWPICEN